MKSLTRLLSLVALVATGGALVGCRSTGEACCHESVPYGDCGCCAPACHEYVEGDLGRPNPQCGDGCEVGCGDAGCFAPVCRCLPEHYVSLGGYDACCDRLAVIDAADECSERALDRIEEHGRVCRHFRCGFRDAYRDVALGGDGRVPTVPPEPYWQAACRTPEGHARAAAWFNGYDLGARHALQDGQQPYRQIATPSGAAGDAPPMDRLPPAAHGGQLPPTQWVAATSAETTPVRFEVPSSAPACTIPPVWPYAPGAVGGHDDRHVPPMQAPSAY